MPENNITMEVVTLERLVFSEQVEAITVPASKGYLGVLPDHAPLVTGLTVGIIGYRKGGETRRVSISGGFMEVAGNKAVILADTAERAEEVDVDRAVRAKERAEKRLAAKDNNLDVARAELSLQRALARLKAASEK